MDTIDLRAFAAPIHPFANALIIFLLPSAPVIVPHFLTKPKSTTMNPFKIGSIKPLLLCCAIWIYHAGISSAQTANTSPKNEFKIGYGVFSLTELGLDFADAVGTGIGSALSLAVGEYASILINGQPTNVQITRIKHSTRYYGTLQVGYGRIIKKRLCLGVHASHTQIAFADKVYYSNGSTRTYQDRLNFSQLYGRIDFNYILQPRFQMYSGVMAGGIYFFESGEYYWAAHVNALGFRFGKKHAFYTELGLGVSSTLTAGYSHRF